MIEDLGFPYVAVHDSGHIQRSVQRAIKHLEKEGLIEIIDEDLVSSPKKGVSVLKIH